MTDPNRAADPATIVFLQERLVALGVTQTPPTGVFDDATRAALTLLQEARGLPVTGEPDFDTWIALLSVDPLDAGPAAFSAEDSEEEPFIEIPPGGVGPLLGEAQLRLRALGQTIGDESSNGPETSAALRRFQADHFAPETGALDEETWRQLAYESADVPALFRFAAPSDLEDQAGALAFGLSYRDVEGSGGYAYRQYEDGAVEITRSPSKGAIGKTLREGPGWSAITAEIGTWPSESPSSLARGAKGPAVRALQERINALGFGPIGTDGDFGPGTVDALRRFQEATGLPVTGALDEATAARLAEPWPTLSPGDAAPEVYALQARLKALGYAVPEQTGALDPATVEAVRAFQQKAGLPVTGAVDAATHGHILAARAVPLPDAVVGAEREKLANLARERVAELPEEVRARVLGVMLEAINWYGLREIPAGSNGGPEIGVITADFMPKGQALPPWCGLAVSHWLFHGLNATNWKETPLGFRNGSALAFGRWGEQKGRLIAGSGHAPPGSILVMYRQGSGSDAGSRPAGVGKWEGVGHTGLVLADLGDSVLSIDGNLSDKCLSRTRKKDILIGYVTWW